MDFRFKIFFACPLVLSLIFPLAASADNSSDLWTWSGNDGFGDSFNISFTYNNANPEYFSISSASFTDSSGTYSGLDEVIVGDMAGNPGTKDQITLEVPNTVPGISPPEISFYVSYPLTFPTPPIVTQGDFSALTTVSASISVYSLSQTVLTQQTVPSVPIPPSIVLFVSVIGGFIGFNSRKTIRR